MREGKQNSKGKAKKESFPDENEGKKQKTLAERPWKERLCETILDLWKNEKNGNVFSERREE